MGFFENEMRCIFGDRDWITEKKYTGKTMLGRLDDNLLVKASFITTEVADHYDALKVKIINRNDGEVDCQVFRFGDIIGTIPTACGKIPPYMWTYHGEPSWYVPVSEEQKESIAETVTDYISMYSEQGLSLQ